MVGQEKCGPFAAFCKPEKLPIRHSFPGNEHLGDAHSRVQVLRILSYAACCILLFLACHVGHCLAPGCGRRGCKTRVSFRFGAPVLSLLSPCFSICFMPDFSLPSFQANNTTFGAAFGAPMAPPMGDLATFSWFASSERCFGQSASCARGAVDSAHHKHRRVRRRRRRDKSSSQDTLHKALGILGECCVMLCSFVVFLV